MLYEGGGALWGGPDWLGFDMAFGFRNAVAILGEEDRLVFSLGCECDVTPPVSIPPPGGI